MSKAFIASTLQEALGCTGVAAAAAADELITAIVAQMKKDGGFTLPSFGTFKVAKNQGAQGDESPYRRAGEGESRQDGSLQGKPEPQESRLSQAKAGGVAPSFTSPRHVRHISHREKCP